MVGADKNKRETQKNKTKNKTKQNKKQKQKKHWFLAAIMPFYR